MRTQCNNWPNKYLKWRKGTLIITLLIILGDLNKANLSRELPKYRQHVTCANRDSTILDHCYTIIKEAYHSVPRAALGLSDHCLVHLILTNWQKLKAAKPVIRTVKRWTNEDLTACFDFTHWSELCGAQGAVGGSVPCSPQSWTIPAGAKIRTHNLGLQVQRLPRLQMIRRQYGLV